MLSSIIVRTVAVAATTATAALAVGAAPAAAAAPPAQTTAAAPAAAGWLAQQFGTHFDYPGGSYFDGGTTADAIYALAAAGVGKDRISAAIGYFAAHVNDYTSVSDTSGKPGPYDGSIGKAAAAALVAGTDPTHFGGYNLLQTLKNDQCTVASHPKNSNDFSTPLCPAPGSARNIYSSISESLAILAEARGARYGAGYAPDAAAMSYFLSLQCADGGFTADTAGGSHCVPDPDATGYAMMALQAAGGQQAALARAAQWLTSTRNADGSWTAQHVHNVDSTGLAAAALHAYGSDTTRSRAWLASQQMTTGPTVGAGASRGALKYHGSFDPSASIKATADGVLGLAGAGSLATLSDSGASTGIPVLALDAPTANRARPVAGSTLTVTGTGFAAGEQVHAVLHSPATDLSAARADKSGTVTLTFTVPESVSGAHTIMLTGARSGLASETVLHIDAATAAQPPVHAPTTPAGHPAPLLANTGLDGRQIVFEIVGGVGLIAAGALFVLAGRRRTR